MTGRGSHSLDPSEIHAIVMDQRRVDTDTPSLTEKCMDFGKGFGRGFGRGFGGGR